MNKGTGTVKKYGGSGCPFCVVQMEATMAAGNRITYLTLRARAEEQPLVATGRIRYLGPV